MAKNGRPTTYRPIYCKKIVDFFQNSIDFPCVAGFAASIGTHKQRLYEWAKIHEKFQDSMREALSIAEQRLHKGALTKEYDPGFAKFLMLNCHGYVSEKTESKSEVTFPSGIEIKFVGGKNEQEKTT